MAIIGRGFPAAQYVTIIRATPYPEVEIEITEQVVPAATADAPIPAVRAIAPVIG